jgi:hypothetical protein
LSAADAGQVQAIIAQPSCQKARNRFGIGQRVRRVEDARFITGRGR